jgi:hypothetical protein
VRAYYGTDPEGNHYVGVSAENDEERAFLRQLVADKSKRPFHTTTLVWRHDMPDAEGPHSIGMHWLTAPLVARGT